MAKYTRTRIDQLSANEQAAIDAINKNLEDLEAAIQDTVSRSGQTPSQMTKDLDMNGQRIINIPEPSFDSDLIRKKDIVPQMAYVEQITQQAINAGNAAVESAQTATSAATNAADSAVVAAQQASRAAEVLEEAVQKDDIVDNTSSTDTDKPASARVAKELQDQITNIQSRGRYLSIWNSTTGLAMTNPVSELPYEYRTGDYFIVGTTGQTNYKPNGSSYTGTASTTVETEEVSVNDTYYYDGNQWTLIHGGTQTITNITYWE